MEEVIQFIMANTAGLVAVLGAAHALAVAVVNLTPTPADDKVVARAYKVIEALAGIFTDTAKQRPGEKTEA